MTKNKLASLLIFALTLTHLSAHAGICEDLLASAKKRVALGWAALTASYQPSIELEPKLDRGNALPSSLGYSGANALTDYWELRESDKVPWESVPHQGFEAINGRQVVAARLYEFFGFTTSQPRVAVVEGRKVVLRKRMDEWRKINDHKVTRADLQHSDLNTPLFRELRLVSALLGERFRLGLNGGASINSRFGDQFSLNLFPTALQDLKAETDSDAILQSTPIDWLPIDHAWRSLTSDDIRHFQDRLAQLNDRTIQKIIALGELQSPDLEKQIFIGLKTRREALLKRLSLPPPTSPVSRPTRGLESAQSGHRKSTLVQ